MNIKYCFISAFTFIFTVCFAHTISLPELGKSSAWITDSVLFPVEEIEGFLAFTPNLEKNKPFRLLLKQPLPIPTGLELVWNNLSERQYGVFINPLVRDAEGNEFCFYSDSYGSLRNGFYHAARFRENRLDQVGEVRMRSEGMRSLRKNTWQWRSKINSVPKLPLTLLGFELKATQKPMKHNRLYFRNFRLTDVSHKNSAFYYQFKDQECFGEIDGVPSFSVSDFGALWSDNMRSYTVDWEVRDKFDGQPFLTGTKTLSHPSGIRGLFHLQMREPVRLPIHEIGCYWIRAKLRGNYTKKGYPRLIRELEFRLNIMRGKPAIKRNPIVASARIGSSMIRVAPERGSLVWQRKEKGNFKVRFYDSAGYKCSVTLHDGAGKVIFQMTRVPQAAMEEFEIVPPDLKTGISTVTASVGEERLFLDRLTRTIGKVVDSKQQPFRLPLGIPSSKEVVCGPDPLMELCPGRNLKQNLRFLDDLKGSVHKIVELPTDWAELEPFPGVYNFAGVDAMLAKAHENGIKILLTFAPFHVPEWMPPHYTENADGWKFGQKNYLFHGARINLFHSPFVRQRALEYLRALVLHFRNHPALLGYYYITEHEGDDSAHDFYEGYDIYAKSNFRRCMKRKYHAIVNANVAWKTNFPDFESAEPPRIKRNANKKLLHDWLEFRKNTIYTFILDVVRMIRSKDPERIIQLYVGGLDYDRLDELKKWNVITANGGCASIQHSALQLVQVAEAGVYQRAEEITCTQWTTPGFPTRLDASFHAMMLGGGLNSHCKMFIPTNYQNEFPYNLDVLRKVPYGLDRFEKFMPLWKELRTAQRVPCDVRFYLKHSLARTADETINSFAGGVWNVMSMMDSQILFGTNTAPDWKKTKFLILPFSKMIWIDRESIKELKDYTMLGGTLLMSANCGRKLIEDESLDWVLLKEFGFDPPKGGVLGQHRVISGNRFCGYFRDIFYAPQNAGEKKLEFDSSSLKKYPALTRRPFGRGNIYILWADTLVPPGDYNAEKQPYPFLRDLVAEAGATLQVAATHRKFWINLLRKNTTWYLFAARDEGGNEKKIKGSLMLPLIPDGCYVITELISGVRLSERSAEDLRKNGIPVSLNKLETAVFRLEKKQ